MAWIKIKRGLFLALGLVSGTLQFFEHSTLKRLYSSNSVTADFKSSVPSMSPRSISPHSTIFRFRRWMRAMIAAICSPVSLNSGVSIAWLASLLSAKSRVAKSLESGTSQVLERTGSIGASACVAETDVYGSFCGRDRVDGRNNSGENSLSVWILCPVGKRT